MDLNAFNSIRPWEWQDDAGEVFIEILRDRQAREEDRLLAAELAGDYVVISNELCAALLAIALDEDEPEDIRAATASSLGTAIEEADLMGFDDPDDTAIAEGMFLKIQKALRAIYMDTSMPELLRRRALESSSRAPQEWHRGAASSAYSGSDAGWKLTAMFCMGFLGGFDKEVLEAMESDDTMLVREAVVAAGRLGLKAAWPILVSLVGSEETDKDVLTAVIEAMVNIWPSEAGMYLLKLANSDDEEIAFVANESIASADVMAGCDDLDEDWNDD